MKDFDLKKYLAENRLLKEDNLRDYWSEWAAGEVKVGNDDVIDAGGVDAAGVGIDPPVPPLAKLGGAGSLVDVMFLMFAKPAAITDAAPINPNIPPCPNALFAPA